MSVWRAASSALLSRALPAVPPVCGAPPDAPSCVLLSPWSLSLPSPGPWSRSLDWLTGPPLPNPAGPGASLARGRSRVTAVLIRRAETGSGLERDGDQGQHDDPGGQHRQLDGIEPRQPVFAGCACQHVAPHTFGGRTANAPPPENVPTLNRPGLHGSTRRLPPTGHSCDGTASPVESPQRGPMTGTADRYPAQLDFAAFRPKHFRWQLDGKVATVTLDRPERKNPLTFDSYAELRDTFRDLAHADTVKAVVIAGAGENFCSGGDVHEIIGPLVTLPR